MQSLIEGCLKWPPEDRPTFRDIVWSLEQASSEYFPGADESAFREYKKDLDRAPITPMDEDLMDLMRNLRNMLDVHDLLVALPESSPFSETILLCFGLMFGDGGRPDEHVILVTRYQLATKGYPDGNRRTHELDGAGFVKQLRTLRNFPPDGRHFPLAEYLMKPQATPRPDQTETARIIETRDDLYAALREILCGICCQHPLVLKFRGWNLRRVQGRWEILIWNDKADAFDPATYRQWDRSTQRQFVWSAAAGVACAHSRGIVHHGLNRMDSIRVKNGRPQICRFGLLQANGNWADFFLTDTQQFATLFNNIRGYHVDFSRDRTNEPDAPNRLWQSFQEFMDAVRAEQRIEAGCQPHVRYPLLELRDQINREIADEETRSPTLPFDIFVQLIRSDCWTSRAVELDVPSAMAEFTLGYDREGINTFKQAFNDTIGTHGFLTPDFLDEFPGFPV
jgi:hypothetical protein